jgi:hypothetical protein
MRRSHVVAGLILAAFLLALAPSVHADHGLPVCDLVDQSTKEVLPGVWLIWDSSFLCPDAPDVGTYHIDVNVQNHATSTEAVSVETITLARRTPRAMRQIPGGAILSTAGLPTGSILPDDDADFTVEASYTLVDTDEGKKANHHYRAQGAGMTSGLAFQLGINVHLRAPGVAAE